MTDLQLMVSAINGVTAMAKAQWVITIRDDGGDVPEVIRFRRMLKVMLRAFGFRCLDIREVKDDPTPESNEVY